MMGARNHGWLVGFLIDTRFTSALRAIVEDQLRDGIVGLRHARAQARERERVGAVHEEAIPSTDVLVHFLRPERDLEGRSSRAPPALEGAMLKCCPKDAACQW